MAYRTRSIVTAVNRAALFASLAVHNHPFILYNPHTHHYAVIDRELYSASPSHFAALGFLPAVMIIPEDLAMLANQRLLSADILTLNSAPPTDVADSDSPARQIKESLYAIRTQDI
jgi:hypothetical protein